MKKQYISPQLEKFTFAVCDVIMTSAAERTKRTPIRFGTGRILSDGYGGRARKRARPLGIFSSISAYVIRGRRKKSTIFRKKAKRF